MTLLRAQTAEGPPELPPLTFSPDLPYAWFQCLFPWPGELSANRRIESSVEELEDRPHTLDLEIGYPTEAKFL